VGKTAETRTTAAIRAYAWRLQLLQGERPALEEGLRILAANEELGTTEDILNARITLAMGHASLTGDLAATIRQLEAVLEDALRANSWVAARAYNNLASYNVVAGELGRSAKFARTGVELARRFTSRLERWLEAALIHYDYYGGAWDRAIEAAEAFIEHPGAASYMDCGLHGLLAMTAAARGDRAAEDAHGAAYIVRAREIGEPQLLQSVIGQCAWLAYDAGDEPRARALADEFTRTMSTDISNFGPDMLEGCIAGEALGLGAELRRALRGVVGSSPLVEACVRVVEGRLEKAGDLMHASEAYPPAALVRLLAAERAGHETSGLREAVSFYESVGATAYLARAERLLQASA
jgi:hypothetical protein